MSELVPTWDLVSILPDLDAFQARATLLEERALALVARADALGPPGEDPAWRELVPALALLADEIAEVAAWVTCAASADTAAADLARAEARATALAARSDRAWSTPSGLLARCEDAAFARLLADPALREHEPVLQQARARRRVLLPTGEQQLFDDLAEDALHGWGGRYRRLSGGMRVELDGRAVSTSQARNLLEAADPGQRERALTALERAWEGPADEAADLLTHIVGVRLRLHDRLGVDELAIPLVRQRLAPETLEALIAACVQARPLIDRYLAARARLLGAARIDWQDLAAPLGQADLRLPFGEAAALVADQLGAFSLEMGDFVRMALRQRWVEAEDRPSKRAGAFCAAFPQSGQSRVFMTFGGGPGSVRTLAHELGHAYHNQVMRDLPWARRRLTSCLAETASTFAETVVRDALLRAATDPATRLALIDRELADATTFLANIPTRFQFERRLFALRRQGPLDPARLSDEMLALQRAWYGPGLGRGFPLFWADKLHFYLTQAPFYNFPYTFGYLFSGMVYTRARQEGPRWAGEWRALLRATGAGPGEEVAQRFLGVDLRQPQAWTAGLDRLVPLVEEMEAAART
ncbi:M3 family metallopeptidase [Myxococcota bacterium]|nr:M3 family metallopeptidase [Myxococcota bacterium]